MHPVIVGDSKLVVISPVLFVLSSISYLRSSLSVTDIARHVSDFSLLVLIRIIVLLGLVSYFPSGVFSI